MAKRTFSTLKVYFRCNLGDRANVINLIKNIGISELVLIQAGDTTVGVVPSWSDAAKRIPLMQEQGVRCVGGSSGAAFSIGVHKNLCAWLAITDVVSVYNKIIVAPNGTKTHVACRRYIHSNVATVAVSDLEDSEDDLTMRIDKLGSGTFVYRQVGTSSTLMPSYCNCTYNELSSRLKQYVNNTDTLDIAKILGYPKQLSYLFEFE